ncbi:glycosyltransferase family 4 protein [Dellaglioa sp. P0083]|uniref:glycosyltransferase family 4 protein n=1 Tax=Dellaglioa kimchii TaxID=3344667 RepID=UPI0038D3DBDE
MKKALMYASVASMIDLFNMDNIAILEKQGYSVEVACNFTNGSITSDDRVKQFKNELDSRGIRTHDIPIPRNIFKVSDILTSYRLTKKILKDSNFKIMHCHSPIGGVIARLAARHQRKNFLTTIYTAHGFHFYKGAPLLNWLIYFPIEYICSFFTDILITINKEDFDRASKWMHPKNNVYVPGIGVDIHKYSDIQDRIEFSENEIIITSVGQLSKRKNHEVVLEAISKIKNKNIHYLIVGEGELREYLENKSIELGIDAQVDFLGYRSDIDIILNSTDIYVFPSLQEGLPVALMEAMAASLPVIASNIRGNIDLITSDINGLLFDPKKSDELANQMEKLITNEKLIEYFKKNQNDIIKKFDIITIENKMNKVYLRGNK